MRLDFRHAAACIVLQALVSPAIAAEPPNPPAPVPQPAVIERVFRQAVEGVVRPLQEVQENAAAVAQMNQQRRQQAVQMQQMLQPAMYGELEFIRATCGELSREAKRAIKEAAAAAVREAAEQFAAQQHRPGRRSVDLQRIFGKTLDPIVDRHASADAVAKYRGEKRAREQRRAETARLLVVSKLDEELDLTAAQREAILADLESLWDAAWLCELLDPGSFVVNGHRPAPDFAAECIEPHLDERQRKVWESWVRVASWRQAGVHLGWRFPDGPGLNGADAWWDR
jgi:hypothetical protein